MEDDGALEGLVEDEDGVGSKEKVRSGEGGREGWREGGPTYLQQDPISHKFEASPGRNTPRIVTDLIGHVTPFAAGLSALRGRDGGRKGGMDWGEEKLTNAVWMTGREGGREVGREGGREVGREGGRKGGLTHLLCHALCCGDSCHSPGLSDPDQVV